ncbi:hypothetical protein PybrP1_010783 [[Pythium] brassicae (nom. inval.)]|nr:hypothetical protein PybrP1_010783 [[Pythium] brassicae (nom. inval.)]
MANKLNAFLASVPANSPVGVKTPRSAGPMQPFVELSLKTEPMPAMSPLPPRTHAQPATPQPQQQRRHASRRNKKFEHHFSKSESARNISFPASAAADGARKSGGEASATAAVSNESKASNQEEPELLKQQKVARSPLSAFNPKQAAQQRSEKKEPLANPQGESEAGPLRRLSAQGSHHRRVSTDTTMFNRYLRHQADRDISMDVVQHFSTVPVVTLSRHAGRRAGAALECTAAERDNNDEDRVDNNVGDVHLSTDPLAILAMFQRGGAISTASALEILKLATNLMSLEQNVLAVRAPYTLVGDLHGQFQDLLEIFNVHGTPSATNPFLFLGDYVDRGISSCEIVLLLLAFKVAFPTSVHLLRGNHECRSLSTFYGFRAECLMKYGTAVYNRTVKCFESMPLAARLETSFGVFLAVHGGLSPEIGHVEDINEQVNRFMEPEPNGALCDLLWSDPAKDSAEQDAHWAPNSVRGCSFTFNERVCRDFLKRNNLLAIIRAHELEEDGFREHFSGPHVKEASGFSAALQERDAPQRIPTLPPVITVFSAPEYCNTNHNMGATLSVPWEARSANVLEYRQHKRSVHCEHEFTLPSEDQAVRAFLSETLPFLPFDFYELIVHCRQLKQMLMLSRQSSIGQLPSPTGIQHTVTDVSIAGGGSGSNQRNSSDGAGSPAVSPTASLPSSHKAAAVQRHTVEIQTQLDPTPSTGKPTGSEVFTKLEWQALKLYFTLLDVSGNGVLMEESFVVLLAEQDSDAYATEDELTLLMEVIDTNADGLITEQDFLLFAYRSYLRWKKSHKKLAL